MASEITLHNMDCLDAMRQMPDKAFDLCITDPPYGINLEYGTYKDTEENWFKLMDEFVPQIIRVSKMAIFPCCRIKALPYFYTKFPPDWLICWHKGSPGHRSFIGFNDWEPLLVYGKNTGVQMHDFFTMNNQEKMGSHNHPCPKPIKWYKWFLNRCLPAGGGRVIEPFLGSGTSAIACYDMGFDLTGYEIDKDYYEAAVKRLENHKKQLTFI